MTGEVTEKVVAKKSVAHNIQPHDNVEDSKDKRKGSVNPFAGPIADNPFSSPFHGQKKESSH